MRKFLKWLIILTVVIAVAYFGYSEYRSLRLPGRSYSGPLQPLDPFQSRIRDHLREHVTVLAERIGERNLDQYQRLEEAALYIRRYLESLEYQVNEEDYTVHGKTARNVYVYVEGSDKTKGTVVIGAHYDAMTGSPGADDNASGVAAVLELARTLRNESPTQRIMLAFFPNEEAPYFQTADMGSVHLVHSLEQRFEKVTAMISVESIGYYSDEPNSQHYPTGIASFYPSTGNFIGFVSDLHSRGTLKAAIGEFRSSTHFPSEGASLPASVKGVGWSDHWAFWQAGYPAIMVTDTALFRNPSYHTAIDTADKLDYDRMARVVVGLKHVATRLAE